MEENVQKRILSVAAIAFCHGGKLLGRWPLPAQKRWTGELEPRVMSCDSLSCIECRVMCPLTIRRIKHDFAIYIICIIQYIYICIYVYIYVYVYVYI